MNILSAYRELICSPALLAQCQQASSVEQFLRQLKSIWRQEALTDDQLLRELAACNQQVHEVEIAALSGHWLPYRYQAKSRCIDWCLPQGHATEPFHDQYIERCRRLLLNQLIVPRTPLKSLLAKQATSINMQPAGFIFHLSRCGSTLVSGCLAELDSTSVLSESPLLTEIMLDSSLSQQEKQHLLPQLFYLQGTASLDRQKIIIKWNAWDIFFWSQIREIYPRVPALFLVRNPVEILASHQLSAGRHMAGDQSMARLSQNFLLKDTEKNILDMRINVLHQLINSMLAANKYGLLVADYTQLNSKKIIEIAHFFGATTTTNERERICHRIIAHSKDLCRPFTDDSHKKRQLFNAYETEKIHHHLHRSYQVLIRKTKQQDLGYAL